MLMMPSFSIPLSSKIHSYIISQQQLDLHAHFYFVDLQPGHTASYGPIFGKVFFIAGTLAFPFNIFYPRKIIQCHFAWQDRQQSLIHRFDTVQSCFKLLIWCQYLAFVLVFLHLIQAPPQYVLACWLFYQQFRRLHADLLIAAAIGSLQLDFGQLSEFFQFNATSPISSLVSSLPFIDSFGFLRFKLSTSRSICFILFRFSVEMSFIFSLFSLLRLFIKIFQTAYLTDSLNKHIFHPYCNFENFKRNWRLTFFCLMLICLQNTKIPEIHYFFGFFLNYFSHVLISL